MTRIVEQCQKMVIPAKPKWARPRQCHNPVWKDGLCKAHHPEEEARRRGIRQEQLQREYALSQGLANDEARMRAVWNSRRELAELLDAVSTWTDLSEGQVAALQEWIRRLA